MKTVKTLVYLLLVCISAFASETTIPIRDEMSVGGPLLNVGHVTLSETVTDGQLRLSRLDEWSVKNVSQHPIVAFVEEMYTQYPDGRNEARVAQYDSFFDSKVLKPGDVLDYSRPAHVTITVVPKSYDDRSEASSTVRIRWVQFSDGTCVGETKFAEGLIKMREGILEALTHLSEVYEVHGPEEFLKELNKTYETPLVDGYIAHLRYFYKDEHHDARETLDRVRAHLEIGRQRSQFIAP